MVPGGFLLGVGCPKDLEDPHREWVLMGDGHLKVTVHHETTVHVLQAQDDL